MVSSGMEKNPTIISVSLRHFNIEQTVGRHWEPYVVRVGVVCLLGPGMHMQVLSKMLISFHCVKHDVSSEISSSSATKNCYIDK